MRAGKIWVAVAFVSILGAIVSCRDKGKVSLEHARAHAEALGKLVEEDVAEVRRGLPEGAKQLVPLYEAERPPKDDLEAVRNALERARGKVQDLRVAKSTFFALVDTAGVVLRNDQEQDLMVGKNVFQSFPALAEAASGKYVETRGSMPEAARVKGPDGQWVAAQPITVGGATKGLYVTGWSWSAYAYRLENSARSSARGEGEGESARAPLLYVYVVVGDSVYGAPISPEVNAKAIADQKPLTKISGDGVFGTTLEITGRDFGLAVKKTPALGEGVGVAVLRSET